ncbi:MAG TPA: CBS domain-containing protein [Gemmataceae bacterium]|jgi:CBS domain-containing protein|nr:CBS domain-containing protein [Gemmataceae bacterium]
MDLARNLKIESVSRLNLNPPLQVGPKQTVAEVVTLMRQEKVGCLLVCQGGKVVGIFTERDLMKRVLARGKPLTLPVDQFMTQNPIVVHPKEPIACAVRRMEVGGYRHLPVVDDRGNAVGVLSVKQIVQYLADHYPASIYNLPPKPGEVPQQREGA